MKTHVYFGGGGIQGLCHVGIIQYLYMSKMIETVKHVAGTSIGAYFGTIFALQIPYDYIEPRLRYIVENLGRFICIKSENLPNLFTKNGIMSLDFLLEPLKIYMQETYGCDDLTFVEFAKKTGINLYVNAVNINIGDTVFFSTDKTPDISVLQALRASMSVPFMFEPVLINGEYYMDSVVSDYSMYKDVDHANILNIQIHPMKDNKTIYDANKNFGFLEHFMRVSEILLSKVMKTNTSIHNTCYISGLHYTDNFRFKAVDNYVCVDATTEDMDKMIVQAFIEISMYFNKQNKKITDKDV